MRRFLPLFLVFLATVSAHGQDFRKSFSLEVGAAPGPLHMQAGPSWKEMKDLAEQGQEASTYDIIPPAVSLSAVWRTGYRWETLVTGSFSWIHAPVTQYETFGIDPQGKPRYDLTKGAPAGWKNLFPTGSLTVQWRVFWNPEWKVQPYSGFGAGLSMATEWVPLPSMVPVGVRFGRGHLYGFLETGFTPFASFGHGGLGWRF